MKHIFSIISLIIVVIFFQSCRSLNPSIMLKTPKDFKYSTFPKVVGSEYRVAPNDVVTFNIYSNDGFKLIDLTTNTETMIRRDNSGLKLKIDFDGTIKLPLLGHVFIQGMTVRELELFLEEKFSTFYNKPFVQVVVVNRRVTIFPGSAGSAKVVVLENENTTLFEALAIAGGISQSGKAYNVKLIRGDLKNPEVYLVDISTLEGVKQANMVLQANDIIYVEPKLKISNGIMTEIIPYLTFITTMVLFADFLKRGTR